MKFFLRTGGSRLRLSDFEPWINLRNGTFSLVSLKRTKNLFLLFIYLFIYLFHFYNFQLDTNILCSGMNISERK